MAHHPFTTRSDILGLPIGPREPNWSSIAGSTLAVISIVGVLEAGLIVRKKIARLKQSLAEPLVEGRELVHEGENAVHEASELAHAVSGVGHALSK